MLQRLAGIDPPLVEYHKHQGALLTKEGEIVALELIRHHRLLELYLVKRLGYTWDDVHSEADRLEHVISEEFEQRLAQELGNPSNDPHGEPIPSSDLRMPADSAKAVSTLECGQSGRVQRVTSNNPDLFRYLEMLGLIPGNEITILDRSRFDDNLTIQVKGRDKPVILGTAVTQKIYVEVI